MFYNLLRNGSLQSNTSSGTGNVSLTWVQLEYLFDQVTDQGGVTVTGTDLLYLDGDLTQRIKVDGINLYHTGLSASEVKFYYKNESSDSYTLRPTLSGAGYLYTTVPSPSAPRWIRCVISGASAQIHEFQIFNDDYIVAFGTDGQLVAEYLGYTPEGSESDVITIPIYNKGTSSLPADAYTSIDPQGTVADEYIQISDSVDGPFLALEDGAIIEDDDVDSDWRWTDGDLNNLDVSGDSLIMGPTEDPGYAASDIPFISSTTYSLRVGHDCMAYDRENEKLYIMGLDDSQLKIWDYDYNTETWDFVALVDPTNNDKSNYYPVMTYVKVGSSRRLYCITNLNNKFGYHEIGGAANNWTLLSSPSWVNYGIYDKVGMCGDQTRFIYIMKCQYSSSTAEFTRFDTVSGTWSAKNNGYNVYSESGGTSFAPQASLAYDYDRDLVYGICYTTGYCSNISRRYIQMYSVASDTWTQSYFNWHSSYIDDSQLRFGIDYIDNYLYAGPNYGTNSGPIHRWHADTLVRETLNFTTSEHYLTTHSYPVGAPIVAISPSSANGPILYLSSITANSQKLYKFEPEGSTAGIFTSPIFKLTSDMNSSFWVVQGTTESGTSSISYNEYVYNGTIRVRSSDTAPMSAEEVYIPLKTPGTSNRLETIKWIPFNNTYNTAWSTQTAGGFSFAQIYPGSIMANRRNGQILNAYYQSSNYGSSANLNLINRAGTSLYSRYEAISYFARRMDFTSSNTVWVYSYWLDGEYRLRHIDAQLNTILYDTGQDVTNFVYDLAAERDGTGVWYSDGENEALVHLDHNGATLHTIPFADPRWVCGTSDNGCWLYDHSDLRAVRVNDSGEIIATVTLNRTASVLVGDYNDGFWYRSGSDIYHVHGNMYQHDFGPITVFNAAGMQASRTGVYIMINTTNTLKFLNQSTGTITKQYSGWSYEESTDAKRPVAVVDYNYDDYAEFKTKDIVPTSYDPEWSTLEWTEVAKDGYFLPKTSYHQVEVTLRGDGGSIDKLIMAPAVNTQDIPAGDYKNMYVKAVIPLGADITEYETKLRTWWGLEE